MDRLATVKEVDEIPLRICLDADDLSGLSELKVGKTYKLQVTAKLKSKTTRDVDNDDDEGTVHGDFEVSNVKLLNGSPSYNKPLTEMSK